VKFLVTTWRRARPAVRMRSELDGHSSPSTVKSTAVSISPSTAGQTSTYTISVKVTFARAAGRGMVTFTASGCSAALITDWETSDLRATSVCDSRARVRASRRTAPSADVIRPSGHHRGPADQGRDTGVIAEMIAWSLEGGVPGAPTSAE
jgi:hypothetical protein